MIRGLTIKSGEEGGGGEHEARECVRRGGALAEKVAGLELEQLHRDLAVMHLEDRRGAGESGQDPLGEPGPLLGSAKRGGGHG